MTTNGRLPPICVYLPDFLGVLYKASDRRDGVCRAGDLLERVEAG